MSMGCSSVGGRRRYDIFLSFRGEDIRGSFARHLYSALCVAGFHTFWDDGVRENICCVERAIEESKLSIVVISRKYASSPWFLDILLKILERFGQQVIPIFLDVDPSEIVAVFSKVFARHDERHDADSRVNRWRVALHMIGNVYGWDLQDHRNESKFIQKIVEDVSCKLSQMYRSIVLRLIGPEPPVAQFVSLLNMGLIRNLTQLEPFGLINNNLNQLQLIDTNKLKSYPESIGIYFKLAELEAHGSISNHVVLVQLYFNNNILNQGLNFSSFDPKQKDKEEMGAQRSLPPLTLSGCPRTVPTEMFDHGKVVVEQDKGESSKGKGKIVQKARGLKPVELEKLPEHLLKLFPDTYEFDKETIVQLWVAEGLFESEEGDRMEDLANSHFDYLIEKKCVSPSGYDRVRRSKKYKITDVFLRSLRNAPQVGYQKVEEAELGSVSPQIQHLFLISKNVKPTSFKILCRFEHLHTLLIFCESGAAIRSLPQDLFSSVKQLRSLGLRKSGIREIPISIVSLKYLRYLDVSETRIKCLPESIVLLNNLQTLKLDGCLNLVSLPRYMNELAKLRHLEFDIFGVLDSMPVKMGNLTSLQTLRAFIVGRKDGCGIVELKNLNNLNGSFCISRLENVLTPHEAKEAAMKNKKYIRNLVLRWNRYDIGRSKIVEEILDCLQPNACLQELRIFSYCGSVFPDWINGSYLCNIVVLILSCCMNCLVLPSLGGLPSLKSLHIIEVTEVEVMDDRFHRSYGSGVHHAFPKLEKLTISGMRRLKEWSGVVNGDFPYLSLFVISSCLELVGVEWLSYLCSLEYLYISDCKEISSLGKEKLPSSLKILSITDCPNMTNTYCDPGDSAWFPIAEVPSVVIDFVERSIKDGGNKGLSQSDHVESSRDGGDKGLTQS